MDIQVVQSLSQAEQLGALYEQLRVGGSFGTKRLATQETVEHALKGMGYRADANETTTFSRELEYVMARTFDVKYGDVKFRSILPVNNEVGNAAESYTYSQFDEFGKAAIVSNFADDFPNVEVQGKQYSKLIKSLGASFSYTIQDLRVSSMTGRRLDVKKAEAARHILERLCDYLAAVGDTNSGLTGLTNHANIVSTTKGAQTTGTEWSTATPDEIVKDVIALLQKGFNGTQGQFTPDTLVVGTKGWSLLSTKRLDSFNKQTIGQYLLENVPWLKSIQYWPRLDTAGSGNLERIMAFPRSNEVLEVFIPQEFEQFPPQARGLAFVVPCHMRFGGVSIRYPKAVTYMDGTQA